MYDIVIVGSGPGGYPAAIRSAQLGNRVAIIEKENLGGVCLNWGCIPTKALLKSAQVYEYVKHASNFGVIVPEGITKDFVAIIKRSRRVADKMNKGVQFLMRKNKIDVITGFGKLIDPNTIEVTDAAGVKQNIQAKNIIIATGGRAKQLPALPIDGKKIISYREALTMPAQPKSMIIVGSGAIGTEFAYFYNSMGTKVTMVEFLPQILPIEDEEVSKELEKQYLKQGINILTGAAVTAVDTSGTEVIATIQKTDGTTLSIAAEVVLSAVGIVANIENIGLENVGIDTEQGKIVVNEFQVTSVPNVYAIGDVSQGPALAHVASKEGIVAAEHIAYLGKKIAHAPEPIDYKNIPSCTYCYPEVASVGITEQAAKSSGIEIKVGKFPFMASGKANAANTMEGFVKVIYDAKYGELLGCHIIGNNATEIIAEAVVARKLETTAHTILNAIHPHPTMSEGVKEATAVAYGEATDV